MATPKEVSVIVRAVDAVTGPILDMNKRIKGFADGVTGFWRGMVAGLAAVGLTSLLRESVKEAAQAEEGWGRLGVSVKNVGGDFKVLRPEIEQAIAATQKMSVATDDDLRDALTNMITISGDYQGSLKNLSLVADVAAFKHIGVSEAADMVGKAMTGNEKVFKGFGIVAGDNASKMEQLRQTVGGFAQNEAETFNGQLKRISNAWDEVQRALGEAIVGNEAMRGNTGLLVESLVKLEKWIHDNEETIGRLVTVMVRFAESVGKILGTAAKGWGMIFQQLGIGGKKALDDTTASQQGQTAAVETHTLKRTKLTKEELAEREAASKKSHEALKSLDEAASKSALELLSANQKAYEETERTFRLKMQGMTKEDYAKAEALLKQTHANQLLAWAGLNSTLDTVIPKAQQTARKEIELSGGATTDFNAVLEKHGKKLDDAAAKTIAAKIRWAEFKEEAAQVAFTIMDGADAMLAFLDALGLGDEKMSKLVAGVGELSEGIGRIASGDLVGGILKGIGGIKSALSGLFGKSEAEKKLAASLDKNRNRLEELTAEIGDLNLNLTGKQLSGTQGALTEFFATGGANAKGWGDRLGSLLLKRGVNMSDLEEVAKTLQIDLRPNGKLDPRMLQQLLAAIGAVEPTQFRTDYRGKRDQLAAETNISNLSPAEQARRLAAIGAGETTGMASSLLGTMDLSSATGRNKGLATIQDLLSRMLSGTMSTAELGGLTGSEFLSLLEDLKGLIESANDANTNPVADSAVKDIVGAVVPVVEGLGPVTSGLDLLGSIDISTKGMWEIMQAMASPTTTGTGLGANTVTVGDITVGDIIVQGAGPGAAQEIAGQLVEAIDQQLALRYRLAALGQGSAAR